MTKSSHRPSFDSKKILQKPSWEWTLNVSKRRQRPWARAQIAPRPNLPNGPNVAEPELETKSCPMDFSFWIQDRRFAGFAMSQDFLQLRSTWRRLASAFKLIKCESKQLPLLWLHHHQKKTSNIHHHCCSDLFDMLLWFVRPNWEYWDEHSTFAHAWKRASSFI